MAEPNEFLRAYAKGPGAVSTPTASGVRNALGMLYGYAKPTIDSVASQASSAAKYAGSEISRAAGVVSRDVSGAVDAASKAVRPHLPPLLPGEEDFRFLLKAGNKIAPGYIPPLEDTEPQPAPNPNPFWKSDEFQQIDAEANPISFPAGSQQSGPKPSEIRTRLEFPEASNKQFEESRARDADARKASGQASLRRQSYEAAAKAGKDSLLRFPDQPPPAQGADSMDRLKERSAANGFPISDAPARGFALPGHEPKNFSVDGAIAEQAIGRDEAIAAMAQEMGVGPQNQFPSEIDEKIAAVRQASGKSPSPVDSQLVMPKTIAYPPPPGALIDAGLAPQFPPTPDEISARSARVASAAAMPRLADGAVVPGLGTGVISPSASNRVATLARDARKAQEARSAEEAAAKLKADATAQQDRAKAETAAKAEAAAKEQERVAAEQEEQRRRSPMAGMGGVMISPAERMNADTNISGRYSGPVGSRKAPMAMSPSDVNDVTGMEMSPLEAHEAGATPDYDLLADKLGLPRDMPEEERLEQARVFWGDQVSRSKNSVVREAQGGGFYFSPTDEAKDRYRRQGLAADARSIKRTYPRSQDGGQEHIEALDQAVAENDPKSIGEIRKRLYDDRQTATAAFIRDRGRMQQVTRNMTDPRLAPAMLAESLKNAQTPQQKADVYRQFGMDEQAELIESRGSAESQADKNRSSTEGMHRLDYETENRKIDAGERVGALQAKATQATADATARGKELDRAQEDRKIDLAERAQKADESKDEADADAKRVEQERKQMGPGDAREAAADRVLQPLLTADESQTDKAYRELPAIVRKHHLNVTDMLAKEGIDPTTLPGLRNSKAGYTEDDAAEELLAQANRRADASQHPLLRVWTATHAQQVAAEAKKLRGFTSAQTQSKQYEAFAAGMRRVGVFPNSQAFIDNARQNGIKIPAQQGS